MGGAGGKLPPVRDRSTRRGGDGAKDIPAASGAFADASAAPPARGEKKGRKTRRKPKENRRERFFSLRLTFKEHAALLRAAGDVPLGVFIRSKLFDQPLPAYCPRRPKHPVKDHQVLGQLLGELGRARLANNLSQLAKAANTGSLPVTPETEKALREACADVKAMRGALMQGLGYAARRR
jgi:hypothetical protein